MSQPTQTPNAASQAATDTATFVERVVAELWRSLADTFGLLNTQEDGLEWSETLADWLTKFIVALLIALIFWAGYWLVRRVIRALVERFDSPEKLKRPIFNGLRYTFFLFAALAILAQFGMSPEFLRNAAVAAVMAFGFYLAWVILERVLENTMKRYKLEASLEQLAYNVMGVLVSAFAFITIMSQFGINVVSVITGLGVVGIAVGFAAQDTLSNFISGITLLIERPFRIGDWVDLSGQIGKVEEISLRTTRVRTRDNAMISIPNANVSSSDIVNFSAGGPLRLRLSVGIAYKESAKEARDILLPVLGEHKNVLTSSGREPKVLLEELAGSSVNLVLFVWILAGDIARQPAIAAEVLESCKEALDNADIEIPFPHLQLFIDEAKGLEPVAQSFLPKSA